MPSLKALFGGQLKVIKNIVSDESNDSKLLYDLLLIIDPSITIELIKGTLKEESLKEEKSFQYHNLLENNKYKSNEELILEGGKFTPAMEGGLIRVYDVNDKNRIIYQTRINKIKSGGRRATVSESYRINGQKTKLFTKHSPKQKWF